MLQIEQISMMDRSISVGEAVPGILKEFCGGDFERLVAEFADSLGQFVSVGRESRLETPVGTTRNEEKPPPSPCASNGKFSVWPYIILAVVGVCIRVWKVSHPKRSSKENVCIS